jgi:hypothetical protein
MTCARWSTILTLFLWRLGTALEIQSTLDSTSSSTGSITSVGGLGVQKNVHVGGTATFNGNVEITGTCTGCGSGAIYKLTGASASFSNSDGGWTADTTYESSSITVRSLKGMPYLIPVTPWTGHRSYYWRCMYDIIRTGHGSHC